MSNKAVTTIDHAPNGQHVTTVTTPSHLLAMAVQQGADLDKLEKLMALHERYEANEARKAYVGAMAAFKAEPMEILKRKLVEFRTRDGDLTSYKHAELSDVTDVVVPTMGKHGLSHRWDVSQKGNEITVACTITHALGHSESVTMSASPDASGKKNAIQQVASTVTYLERYTLLALTGMATKGMDDDGRGYDEPQPEPVDAKAADWIKQANQLQEPGDYEPTKAKMLKDYGGVLKNIPQPVKDAFNAAKAKIMPKDEA